MNTFRRPKHERYWVILQLTIVMVPDERALLQSLGIDLLIDCIHVTVYGLIYGIFIPLFLIVMRGTIRRELKTRSTRILFAISCLSFLAVGISWSLELAAFVEHIQKALIDNPHLPSDERLSSFARQTSQESLA